MKNRSVVIGASILGFVFLIIGVVYFTHTADALPSFFPGHQAGVLTTHTKHGLAAVVLAVLSFVVAWFQSAPKKTE